MNDLQGQLTQVKEAAARLSQIQQDQELVESLPRLLEREHLENLLSGANREVSQLQVEIRQNLQALDVRSWREGFYNQMTIRQMHSYGTRLCEIQQVIADCGARLWGAIANRALIRDRIKNQNPNANGPFPKVPLDSSVVGGEFVNTWNNLTHDVDLDCFEQREFNEVRFFVQRYWRAWSPYRTWGDDGARGAGLFIIMHRR